MLRTFISRGLPVSRSLGVLSALCLLSSGQANPVAPMPRESPPTYFPTAVGTKWVYEWTIDGRKEKDVTEVVAAVEEGKDGAKVVTVHRALPERTYPFQKWEVSERGLLLTDSLLPG